MKNKVIIIPTIIVLFFGGIFFLRQVPNYVMSGHWQFLYYRIIDLQSFAKKHNYMFFPKLYKSEAEAYLSVAVPQAKKDMDKVIIEAYELYKDYVNNQSPKMSTEEYKNKLNELELQLNLEIGLKVYIDLLKITDKYLLIPFGLLPTDWSGNWAECFMPYFEKYDVDKSELVELENFLELKQQELNIIRNKFDN